MRPFANLLCLWRLCSKPACARSRSCRGDVRRCFPRHAVLLPEGVQHWYECLRDAQSRGEPFDQAVEALDESDEGDALRDWVAAVSASLGGNDTLPVRWWNVR